ncbi:MAG: acyl-CoA reductase [Deltaproteobacteria bacterium]|nr:acyl-CoA reductase [Deltaproteobacteria bacterium]MBI3295799.1 acyl-CoA reductase [Deltaproteobacteria bacterium]
MTRLLPSQGVRYRVGRPVLETAPLAPYDTRVCAFLNELSRAILKAPEVRVHPDLVSFAYWCRASNISQLKGQFASPQVRLGLGAVLHIAPSNVPLNFAFSYAFSLLAGNANIVRLPSNTSPQIDALCDTFTRVLSREEFKTIEDRTAIIEYVASDALTTEFSQVCRARVIWGGDETVCHIRRLPLPARTIDLAFADRASLMLIDPQAVIGASREERHALAHKFFNDTYLMDQNACSSPHLILWKGLDVEKGQDLFWTAVAGEVEKNYPMSLKQAADKYVWLCQDAIEQPDVTTFEHASKGVYRIGLKTVPSHSKRLRGHSGYFYECTLSHWDELTHFVDEKYQTATYFGVDPLEVREAIMRNGLTGLDRIVKVGDALDIGVIWDGLDIVATLSRIVDVRS